ncbi:MAG TPA: YIP1 family protein [Pyrinomonadaceae bacterium]|nr:YIP1 family protein [Pyrinomonadaceae bacterium]
MRRILAVIIFVLGVALLIAGLKGWLLQGVSIGALLTLTGGVLFGVSFIAPPAVGLDAPPPLSPFGRVAGLFFEPSRVFRNLRAHPRWVLAFAIILLCSVVYNLAFTQRLGIEAITAASVNRALQDQPVTPAQAASITRQQVAMAKSPFGRITQVIGQAVSVFLFMVVLAALFKMGIAATGGRINFWQSICVGLYAAVPPVVIHSVLSLVILYAASPDDIDPVRAQRGLLRDNLGLLFSPVAHPILYTVATFIGFVSLYGLWLTAKGLHHASERSSAGGAWTVALAVWLINLGFSVGMAALYPKFI